MERLSVMGLVEVLARLFELLWRRHKLVRTLLAERPDVFIGIDAPDFNLGLELKLRRAGIRTVHYVSPSVWAWRQKRVFKIRQACDLMLTLFPFEARFYEEHGVPVRFVGHPLANTIPLQVDRAVARLSLGLATDAAVVALMPGSRGGEVTRLGPLFLDTAERLSFLRPGLSFVLPCASQARREQLERLMVGRNLQLGLLDGRSHEALAACDAVLIASGTATLEALLHQRPMVVAYRVANLTYRIVRRLIKTSFFSLPNLLAGRQLVPEFIQDAATPDALAEAVSSLLQDDQAQTESFAEIHRSLRQDASAQAAEAVLGLVGR
jgi:lipid-A-disaccharide synthase